MFINTKNYSDESKLGGARLEVYNLINDTLLQLDGEDKDKLENVFMETMAGNPLTLSGVLTEGSVFVGKLTEEFKNNSFIDTLAAKLDEKFNEVALFTLEDTNLNKVCLDLYRVGLSAAETYGTKSFAAVDMPRKRIDFTETIGEGLTVSYRDMTKTTEDTRVIKDETDNYEGLRQILPDMMKGTNESIEESYKHKDVIKDWFGNFYKVRKVENNYYKVETPEGVKLHLKKDAIEPISTISDNEQYTVKKETYRKSLDKGLKEETQIGQEVDTPDGKGKVTKVDGDDVWVTYDSEIQKDNERLPAGVSVAYKAPSLVTK